MCIRDSFEAFTFARHVCEDQLGVQRIVVVLNQQVLLAGNVERLGVVFDARALGDEQGRLALGLAGRYDAHLDVYKRQAYCARHVSPCRAQTNPTRHRRLSPNGTDNSVPVRAPKEGTP